MTGSLLLFVCALINGVVNAADNLGMDTISTLTELNTMNFDSHVFADDKPWAVVFFAPWCRYSVKLAPVWMRMSEDLQDVVRMGYVNVLENRPLQRRFKINRYPTVYMFFADKSNPEKYKEKKTEQLLTLTFVNRLMTQKVKRAVEEKPPEKKVHDECREDNIPNNDEAEKIPNNDELEKIQIEDDEDTIPNEDEEGNISNEFE